MTVLSPWVGMECHHTQYVATSEHAAIGPGESPDVATYGCATRVGAGALMGDT